MREMNEKWVKYVNGTAAAASGHKVNLVLIDCLLSILGTGLSRNVVQDQRRQIQELRALATKYEFALVIIHHTCKKSPKGAQGFSVFDAMLGTTGIGTVVDVGVVLEKTRRPDGNKGVELFAEKERAVALDRKSPRHPPKSMCTPRGSKGTIR